jgi:hypothetical protein
VCANAHRHERGDGKRTGKRFSQGVFQVKYVAFMIIAGSSLAFASTSQAQAKSLDYCQHYAGAAVDQAANKDAVCAGQVGVLRWHAHTGSILG